jgi:hypothetical protein
MLLGEGAMLLGEGAMLLGEGAMLLDEGAHAGAPVRDAGGDGRASSDVRADLRDTVVL